MRPLGRHVEHDPRSRDYAVTVDEAAPLADVLHTFNGTPLNQGQLGSCTGNALVGCLRTAPLYAAPVSKLTEKLAVKVYSTATTLDSVPGSYPPDDTGSSGLAACKAARKLGLIGSYTHAFSLQAALAALQASPVMVGVNWYDGFDTPDPTGLVAVSGSVRGGHEFALIGYTAEQGGRVHAVNSWGTGWGVKGRFQFSVADLGRLLGEQGDVTVPHR